MKKLLALVLALVMTLGLATVGANAADFKDEDSIEYEEAVNVMSGIGVIQGDDNGNFNPKGTLTREQAAKIVAYMMLGQKGADSLSASAAPFSDVAADRWSAGAIAYCATEGIIAGLGDGTFNPTGKLTGHQFAKMLLVALGYNAKYEGFVDNRDWAINVAKLAVDAGLEDDLAIVMSQDMNREQAAMMAFNTLTADMVDYENPVNVKTNDGTEVNVNAKRFKTENTTVDYNTRGTAATDGDKFCEVKFSDLRLQTIPGDFGDLTNQWSLKGVEISAEPKKADATILGHVTEGALYKAIGAAALDNIGTMRVYVDGVEDYQGTTDPWALSSGSSTTLAAQAVTLAAAKLTSHGTITNVYTDWTAGNNYNIYVSIQHVFVGKVSSIKEASGSDAREVTISAKTQPSGIFAGTSVDRTGAAVNNMLDPTFETDEFSKGDIVLYTAKVYTGAGADDAEIMSMKLATKVSAAELTKTTAGRAGKVEEATATVGGKDYNYNLLVNHADGFTVGDKFDLYLDEQGAIVYTTLAEEDLDLNNYLVLVRAGMDATIGNTPYADAITLAGTKLNAIKLNKVDGTSPTDWSTLRLFKVYKYTVSGSNYDLKTVGGNYLDKQATGTETGGGGYTYTTGSSTLGTGIVGNDSTILYTYDLSDKGTQKYTGIKNIPNVDSQYDKVKPTDPASALNFSGLGTNDYNLGGGGKGWAGQNYTTLSVAAAFLTKDGKAVAGVLCVNDDTTGVLQGTSSVEDIVYVTSVDYSTSKNSNDDPVYTFNAIKDGKVTTISTDVWGVQNTIRTGGQGLYFITEYDGEYVSTLSGTLNGNAANKGDSIGSPTGITGNTYTATYDVDTYGANIDVSSNTLKIEVLNALGVASTDSVALDTDCVFYEISSKGAITPRDAESIEADAAKGYYVFIFDKNTSGALVAKAVFYQKT